jgi:GT2 family glycosyltransferase
MGWLDTTLVVQLTKWTQRGCNLYMPQNVTPVAFARNLCVAAFLQSYESHLWFIDDDTVPCSDALDKLLLADQPAVSGIVPALKLTEDGALRPIATVFKHSTDIPDAYRSVVPDNPGAVERIDACGAACWMIQREVFDKIPYPWFEDFRDGRRGEDIIFSRKLEEAGIPLYAHYGVRCMHRKEVDLG